MKARHLLRLVNPYLGFTWKEKRRYVEANKEFWSSNPELRMEMRSNQEPWMYNHATGHNFILTLFMSILCWTVPGFMIMINDLSLWWTFFSSLGAWILIYIIMIFRVESWEGMKESMQYEG